MRLTDAERDEFNDWLRPRLGDFLRYAQSLWRKDSGEAESIALVSIVEARATFDPSRGMSLEAYIRLRIHNDIANAKRKMKPVPWTTLGMVTNDEGGETQDVGIEAVTGEGRQGEKRNGHAIQAGRPFFSSGPDPGIELIDLLDEIEVEQQKKEKQERLVREWLESVRAPNFLGKQRRSKQ